MVAGIFRLQPVYSLFVDTTLICNYHSKIFEVYHIFEVIIICIYIYILACILVMRYEHLILLALLLNQPTH